MPMIPPAPIDAWASVTLTGNEDWQCRAGMVLVTTEAPPAGSANGIMLRPGDIMQFNGGETVHYRALEPGVSSIWREPRP